MRAALLALACLVSCVEPGVPEPVRPRMLYEGGDLWSAPFPGEHLRRDDGTIDLSSAPNVARSAIVRQVHEALVGIDGFGTTSPIHFQLSGPIDASALPTATTSTRPDAPMALLDVDAGSPERGTRRPFTGHFQRDGGPFGSPNALTLLPVQGIPLRPRTLYAAVLTDALRDERGAPLARAAAVDDIAAGRIPPGMSERAFRSFREAWDELPRAGIDPARVVAFTAFRTGDPLAVMRRAVEATADGPLPEIATPFGPVDPSVLEDGPERIRDVFDEFCAFEATLSMPVFQQGEPPYATGGAWALDETGAPILQRTERARLVVTVPRTAMPADGFPLAVLIRTGLGGPRPLVDRGAAPDMDTPPPRGSGPAREFARAGFAGLSVDGPHVGLRNPDGGDEQFRVFNVQNPIALRDNLRQSALELVLLARALASIRFDATSCPGFSSPDGAFRIDVERVALFGHSMGASIAPLAAAFEPRFRALILSGAGASWIENVIHKQAPIATRPFAETLLRYNAIGRTLDVDDPALGMLQWAGEAADAQVYAPLLVLAPEVGSARQVLVFQGIVDHYILPPIANALSLALGVDRAGPALDRALVQYTPVDALLPLRGRGAIALPARANLSVGGVAVTAVVTQHPEDGIQDGHEVVFQAEAPKAQYRCFLRTFAAGAAPLVPDPGAVDPDCE